ncbi:ftsX-like permease family protein, partial [Vibrio parahaemolyticus AQ3810]
RA